jgi:hypothetical protein
MLIGGGKILVAMLWRSLVTLASIFTLLYVASVSHIYVFAQDANLTEQQQISELKSEVEELKTKVNNNGTDFLGGLFGQLLALIVAGGATAIGAVLTWQFQRRIPPTAEQERIIHDIIKQWYSRNYLYAYHNIWKKIEESNEDEDIIDQYWCKLSAKKFPEDELSLNKSELDDQIEYFRKKLHLGKREKEEIQTRIKAIQNSADVEYYAKVRLILPTVVDIAVTAAIDYKYKPTERNYADKVYESLVKSSLNKLKRLMIFYRIRENKEVCKILIQAKLNEKILGLGSASANTAISGDEL